MPHLVGVLAATPEASVSKRLGAAYLAIARLWLGRQVRSDSAPDGDWIAFARRVQSSDRTLSMAAAAHLCPDVDAREWNATEVLNCLNHMEVLLAASEVLESRGWQLTKCAPTQQYSDSEHAAAGEGTDASMQRISDLAGYDETGAPFILEAYGGHDFRNNSKAAQDLDTLRSAALLAPTRPRLLVAVRRIALGIGRWSTTKTETAVCAARHGGPFKVAATIRARWELHAAAKATDPNAYCILELGDVSRVG